MREFPKHPPPPSQGLIKNIVTRSYEWCKNEGNMLVTKFQYVNYNLSSALLLQVPVIRTFILYSGDEAQCTDKAM